MSCLTRPGSGPGLPYVNESSVPFRKALEAYDLGGSGEETLDSLLAGAREEDAVTLWHLLFRVDEGERGRVYDRIARLVPAPEGTSREGLLNGDRQTIDAWQDQLGLGPFYSWEFTQ
jgi:hypothetical protein